MNKIEIPKVNLNIYSEKLPNGLEVFVVPKTDSNNICVTLTTKFGSMHGLFIKDGEIVKVPPGTAHFLEHKVFEQHNGISTFQFFSERGAESNASTSRYHTSYYFSGKDFIDENIEFLLDCVQNATFAYESVEKEKGIIEQEIKMYQDSPPETLHDLIMENTFVKHPIRYSIGGTIESINMITEKTLTGCYNIFYQPSNMFMTIVGNVDPEHIIEVVKQNQAKKNIINKEKIELVPIEEPDTVVKKKVVTNMNVVIPKVAVSFKINIEKFNNFKIGDIITYIAIYFNNKYGYISVFNEQMRETEIISSNIDVSTLHTNKHVLVSLFMDSKQADVIVKKIIEETKKKTIDKDDFERAKKVIKSSYIYMSDSIYAIGNSILDQVIKYDKLIADDLSIIERYNFKDYQYLINNISLKNYNVTIINPNK